MRRGGRGLLWRRWRRAVLGGATERRHFRQRVRGRAWAGRRRFAGACWGSGSGPCRRSGWGRCTAGSSTVPTCGREVRVILHCLPAGADQVFPIDGGAVDVVVEGGSSGRAAAAGLRRLPPSTAAARACVDRGQQARAGRDREASGGDGHVVDPQGGPVGREVLVRAAATTTVACPRHRGTTAPGEGV